MKIESISTRVIIFTMVIFYWIIPRGTYGQDTILNQHNLWVVMDVETLRKMADKDSTKAMVDLNLLSPGVRVDLKYATKDNLLKKRLYPKRTNTAWLRLNAAKAIAKVQAELSSTGMGLKIFDAYRPYPVTEKIWNAVKDERYAADPKKGSGHNRGTAVDLTIIDIKTGKEFNMGTQFDNFSDTAHHDFKGLPKAVLANRSLLKKLMMEHGFNALDTEWWHYSLLNTKDYELLGIEFDDLKKLKRKKGK